LAEGTNISDAVLIVDDDPSIGALLEHTLRRDGFTAVSVLDGASARAYVDRETPEAIILDLGLPDIDGKELLGDLIDRRPEVPVLVLTASDAVDDIVECMRLGAVDYIQKPFDRTRVTTTVVNATRQAKLRRSVGHQRRRRASAG
jgi:DNA-binding response OmpR family regulator